MPMPPTLVVQVYGTPKATPRSRNVGRRVVMTDRSVRLWRQAIERAAVEAICNYGREDWMDGPVRLDMEFRFPTPKRERWGLPHTNKPDWDNLAKTAADCLERCGVLRKGDQRIVASDARKLWAEHGGLVMRLSPMADGPFATMDNAPADWLVAGSAP